MTSVDWIRLVTKPLDIKELEARATEVSGLLKTLSHPNRLRIACTLKGSELSVSEIEAETSIAQPHVSRELARMREAGLVAARRESKNVYYCIADDKLVHLIDALCQTFKPKGRTKSPVRKGKGKRS